MSGPDYRDRKRTHGRVPTTMGLDDEFGMDIPEDYTVIVVGGGGKRHFHVKGDVESLFVSGDGTENVTRIVTDDIESDFKAQCIISGSFGSAFNADFNVEEY